METRIAGQEPSLPKAVVQDMIEDTSEQTYFYLQMAWVEMLEAVDLLHTIAQAGKCPVDLAFYGEAEEIKSRISALQAAIRAHANNEYTGDNNANA